MVAGNAVARDRKTKNPPAPVPVPQAPRPDDEGAAEYTEHVLVPLPFKERLERIAQKVNQERRRQKLPKRPLGWFVVRYLRDWMDMAEATQGPPPAGG
jgi:hypothetical protein